MEIIITEIDVTDVRFPTSLLADGSDAMVSEIYLYIFSLKVIKTYST